MPNFTMTIAGRGELSDRTFGVINPANEEVFAAAPDASREDLDAAVRAANDAFPAWRDTSLEVRREALGAIANRLEAELAVTHGRSAAPNRPNTSGRSATPNRPSTSGRSATPNRPSTSGRSATPNRPTLAEVLVCEQGKKLSDAQLEIGATIAWLRATTAMELTTEVLDDSENKRVELRRKPLGVVGAITPWNYPLLLSVWKVAPALLAGNTVVLKPSPYTPLTVLRFGEIARDVLPPGVLNVVSGGDDLGRWITEHPDVQKISFTGSGATGKQVMASASQSLKRITLELGGNDAAIVRADADPHAVAGPIFEAAFMNSGQVCTAIKRLYVHEDLYDALCAALVEQANNKTVGDGMDPSTDFGPVQNRMQYERVCELAESARAQGGRFLIGGEPRPGKGYFFPLTLVADLSDGSRLVDEEPFGPILPIIRYRDDDDAVRRANASSFGLGGSVWSADVQRATEMASRLEAGSAWVNQHLDLSPLFPFGGAKESGMGVENGALGLAEFTRSQVVNVKKA